MVLSTIAWPAAAFAAPATPVAPPPPAPPKASILVDATTGEVLAADNEREALPPASLTKLLTALAALDVLGADAAVPVSEQAAAMPARKVNLRPGDSWPVDQLLSALLLSSANDAAAAFAEAAGDGTVEGFIPRLEETARRLGLEDAPQVRDPAGLDDEHSVGGGNLISARDMAIIARAALARPEIADPMATAVDTFTDPAGVARKLVNHNRLLKTYAGAVGMKTGYTKKAGRCLAVAATRDGRTLIAITLDDPGDMYATATRLLDRGFAGELAPTGDVLPPVPGSAPAATEEPVSSATDLIDTPTPVTAGSAGGLDRFARSPAAVVVGALGVVVGMLRMRAIRRQRRRAWRRHPLAGSTTYRARRVA